MTILMGIRTGNKLVKIVLLIFSMSSGFILAPNALKMALIIVVMDMSVISIQKNGWRARMICLGCLMNCKSLRKKLEISCLKKLGFAWAFW